MTVRSARALLTAGAFAALVLLLGASAASAAGRSRATQTCRGRSLLAAVAGPSTMRQATLCLINHRRAARGLRPLHFDSRLEAAADGFSRRMVAQSFFAHVGPDGVVLAQRVRAAGYLGGAAGWRVGENLAFGHFGASSPTAIVRAWMHSAVHRRTMLDPGFRDIGIGIASGTPGASAEGVTVTADFGRRSARARR